MRTIVAGSRDITDQSLVNGVLDNLDFTISCVISGGARGPDRMGEVYARTRGIDFTIFHANWKREDGSFNKAAGHIRNRRMAEHADALVAFWDGISHGTEDMIDIARSKGLIIRVI